MGAVITYAGLMIVFLIDLPEGGRNVILGTALVLGCSITFAVYQLLAKKIISFMGSLLFTAIAMSGSSVACILHYTLSRSRRHHSPHRRGFLRWVLARRSLQPCCLHSSSMPDCRAFQRNQPR